MLKNDLQCNRGIGCKSTLGRGGKRSLRSFEQERRECLDKVGNSSAMAIPWWELLGASIDEMPMMSTENMKNMFQLRDSFQRLKFLLFLERLLI